MCENENFGMRISYAKSFEVSASNAATRVFATMHVWFVVYTREHIYTQLEKV